MTPWRVAVATVLLAGACSEERRSAPPVPPDVPVPVALNADSPFGYPTALYEAGVTGEVVLRLYVDSAGRLVPESTRVAEPSGHAALDSAALAGAPALRFAPAIRRGLPVGTAFLQPVRFRRPDAPTAAPAGGPPGDSVTAAPVVPTPPQRRSTPRATPVTPPPAPTQRADSARTDSIPRNVAPRDTVPRDTVPRDTVPRDTLRVDTTRVDFHAASP